MIVKNRVYINCIIAIFFMMPCLFANEFVVPKKAKAKKEVAVHVKEDIVELLESSLRQLGRNIKQAVIVEDQIFDQLKELLTDDQMTTAQLKDLRDHVEKYLQMIEQQQSDLESFSLQIMPKKK